MESIQDNNTRKGSTMTAEALKTKDIELNTRLMTLLAIGDEYRTWCYAVQTWVIVRKISVDSFSVKCGRKFHTLSQQDAVSFVVTANQG